MSLEFDPRTKLFMIVLSPIIMALHVNIWLEIVIVFIYLLPFFLTDEKKLGTGLGIVYALQLLGYYFLLPEIEQYFFLYIVSFLTYGLRRLMLGIIAGIFAIKTTQASEWISLLKKWKAPHFILIPLSVMLRFFPTIYEDYKHIRQAMAFRGIGNSFWDLIKKPLQSFEYIVIPILINASQVAEDLTISALTKGLSSSVEHTSIVSLDMEKQDWLYIMLLILPVFWYIGSGIL